jgi:hypothetical protein
MFRPPPTLFRFQRDLSSLPQPTSPDHLNMSYSQSPLLGLPNELLFEIISDLAPADLKTSVKPRSSTSLKRFSTIPLIAYTVQRRTQITPELEALRLRHPRLRQAKVTSVFSDTQRIVLTSSDRHANSRKPKRKPMRPKRKRNRRFARKKVAEKAKQQEGDHLQMTARCLSRCRGHLYTSLVYQRQARISVPSITASASGVTFPRKNAMRCVHGSTRSSTTRAGVGLAIRRCLNA